VEQGHLLGRTMGYRIAGVVLFAICSVLIGEMNYSSRLPQVRLSQGKEGFEKYCRKCHSLEAGESGFGPTLHRIASVASTRRSGQSAVDYLWESVVDPAAFKATEGIMPVGLASEIGREKLFQIISYLMSIEGNRDYASLWGVASKWQPVASEAKREVEWSLVRLNRGKELFYGKGKCAECHILNPVNSADYLLAPSLSGVGVNDEAYLRESLNCPSCYLSRGYRFGKAMIEDELVSGRLIEREDGLVLINRKDSGFLVTKISKEDDIEWSETKTSLMPAYADGAFSGEEMDDLILFLRSLR